MLPFNLSALKAIAKKEDDGDRKYKTFEVQDGTVAVWSGHVVVAVSNFSPLENDTYEFDSNDRTVSRALFPWVKQRDLRVWPHRVTLPQPLVARLYKVLKAWLACKPKADELIPHAQIELQRIGTGTIQITLSAAGTSQLPELHLEIEQSLYQLDTFADRIFAYNAKELLDALSLFGKLKADEGQVVIDYSSDPREPIFLYAEDGGHEITAGLPFIAAKRDEDEAAASEPIDDFADDDEDDSELEAEAASHIFMLVPAGTGA